MNPIVQQPLGRSPMFGFNVSTHAKVLAIQRFLRPMEGPFVPTTSNIKDERTGSSGFLQTWCWIHWSPPTFISIGELTGKTCFKSKAEKNLHFFACLLLWIQRYAGSKQLPQVVSFWYSFDKFLWYLRGWLIDPNYRYNDVPGDEDATIPFQRDLGDSSL